MKTLLTICLIALVAGGCSTYRITRNEVDKTADWPAYRTYAFVDTTQIAATPGTSFRAAIEPTKQAIAAELQRRGYQPTRDNPDLLVNLGAVVKEKTQTRQTTIQEAPVYVGQRRYSWQSREVPVGTYQEGTINLHFVDAQRNALIWDVAVSSVLTGRGNPADNIRAAVAKVFGKFPGRAQSPK